MNRKWRKYLRAAGVGAVYGMAILVASAVVVGVGVLVISGLFVFLSDFPIVVLILAAAALVGAGVGVYMVYENHGI